MKEIKPQFKNLCSNSDLEKMNTGDFTNVNIEGFLSKITPKNKIVVYEGAVGEKDSFIMQHPKRNFVINLRIQRDCINFNNGLIAKDANNSSFAPLLSRESHKNRGKIYDFHYILNSSFIMPVLYKKNSGRYEDAKQLLINAEQWRNKNDSKRLA